VEGGEGRGVERGGGEARGVERGGGGGERGGPKATTRSMGRGAPHTSSDKYS
jgi:hypothetical protein